MDRFTDERRWEARREAFGDDSLAFWSWQERTADALWNFALRNPTWPPQTMDDAGNLIRKIAAWIKANPSGHLNPSILRDALSPVSRQLRGQSDRLRLFIDAQLLIASQAVSRNTFALYGASALDLPRRGVVHIKGGIGSIADLLVNTVRQHGGEVHFRQEVTKVLIEKGLPVKVETKRGESFRAKQIVFNLPPWNIARLLGDQAPPKLKRLPKIPQQGGGAFMVYVGLDESALPSGFPLHHQVIKAEPLREGNSIFLSISPPWESDRAPKGQRAITISTHTHLEQWWALFDTNKEAYDERKAQYIEKILIGAESIIPGFRESSQLIMPGTPVTFSRFTRRDWGWVGGFPQSHLLTAWGPRITPNLWMVGDTIFPGQSVPAVALGGIRVAESILHEMGCTLPHTVQPSLFIPTE